MILKQSNTGKRILVLTADAGFGHRRAAEAIEAALAELYGERCETTVVNPLHAADAPDIVRQIEAGYDEMVAGDPTLYRIAYQATDAPLVSDIIAELTTRLLDQTMLKYIQEHQPHAVVTTYPAYAQPVASAIKKTGRDTALAVVITDLTDVHALWYSPAATMHFVPTAAIRQQALDNRIPATRVRVTGLPVHPAFARETRDPATLRAELGWELDMPTGLVVASARTRQMAAIVRLLDRAGITLQLAVVSGGAGELYEALQDETWQGLVHLYGRVDNMPQLMRASDFIVTKAGGLITSEALACGLPLVISEALPGQEVGNARYVVDGGAGAWAPGAMAVLATVVSWLRPDDGQLVERRENARKLGKPRAAYDIAEGVWGLA
jgi:UDP-N-acetylglucosamine:LPS N-acetylglucosamine transferase